MSEHRQILSGIIMHVLKKSYRWREASNYI